MPKSQSSYYTETNDGSKPQSYYFSPLDNSSQEQMEYMTNSTASSPSQPPVNMHHATVPEPATIIPQVPAPAHAPVASSTEESWKEWATEGDGKYVLIGSGVVIVAVILCAWLLKRNSQGQITSSGGQELENMLSSM